MTRRSATLSAAAVLAISLAASGPVRAQQQPAPHGDSTHVSDWLNALPVSRAALAEYHRRKEAGLLPGAAKSASDVGDTLTFKVWNFRESRSGQTVLDSIDFRLELASDNVHLWVELAELDGGSVSRLKIEQLFRALAERTPPASIDPGRGIMANCEALFGAPPNVDGDGAVDVLLLRIRDDDALVFGVNVAGFVWSGDLTERGNNRDVVYIDVDADYGKVVAHEYQHLIRFNYDRSELTFVKEGLARLSEVANGYAPDDIPPGIRTRMYDAPLLRFGRELSQNIRDLNADYLRAGLFTTYMAERIGYAAAGAITRDSIRQGVDSYAAALDQHGIALEDFVLDFHVANVLNRVDLQDRYGYRTPVYRHVKYATPHSFDARIWKEVPPIEVKVKEGAPKYFAFRHARNLTIAVTPKQDTTSLRGLALLQRDGRLEVAPLSIGSQTNTFEGAYDEVTIVVVHVHPTNTGQGIEQFVVSSSWESTGVAGSFVGDVAALKVLYDSTGGPGWINRDGWDFSGAPTPEEVATWHGVEMESGRVSRLILRRNGLSGVIPDEIGNLSVLRELTLVDDSLGGTIPRTVGKLAQLEDLTLSGNDLEGNLPVELAKLPDLIYVLLGENRLTGEIPPEYGSLPRLRILDLRGNALTGEVPRELGRLATLSSLGLSGNRLTGTIPRELGNAAGLHNLSLGDNALVGEIPPELGHLPRLRALHLSGNALTGPIPSELGGLIELEHLRLESNGLSGEVPSQLGNLVQLKHLDLSDNVLTGGVPQELGQLEELEYLDLSANALTGPLPASLTNLRSLRDFYFDGQDLCAPADVEFLEWLDGLPPRWRGRSCVDNYALAFAGTVEDQQYELEVPIDTLFLPDATGGIRHYTYTLSPALPLGLVYNRQTRSIRGIPYEVTARTTYTFSARDSFHGSGILTFDIEVIATTDSESATELPERLALSGNAPNPFLTSTVVRYDLPARARVSLHVFDVLGRRILVQTEEPVEAGWQRTLTVDGNGLAPGVYLYQLIAETRSEPRIAHGKMMRVR